MLEAHELHKDAHWPYALLIDWDKICLSVAIIAGNNDTIADPGVLYDHCHHHHHDWSTIIISDGLHNDQQPYIRDNLSIIFFYHQS